MLMTVKSHPTTSSHSRQGPASPLGPSMPRTCAGWQTMGRWPQQMGVPCLSGLRESGQSWSGAPAEMMCGERWVGESRCERCSAHCFAIDRVLWFFRQE
jgi:hypothetical protein